jgi:accessory Sec system protein Asp3
MMSVGGKIKTWHSHSTYAESRISPMLPLLTRNQTYQISLFLEANPHNNFQVAVTFYDKFNQEIATHYFDTLAFVLTYPQDAVNYDISLINNKHDVLIFYFMVITEVSPEEAGNTCEMSRQDEFSVLTSRHLVRSQVADNLEIVVHYLVRETSVFQVRDDGVDALHFFVSESEASFLKSSFEIIKAIGQYSGTISLLQGLNFKQLPHFYQLLPHILREILPELTVSTTITSELTLQKNRDIRKYVRVLAQMLERDKTNNQ